MKTTTRTSGFTLIEMLVVIAIIALLASLLVPAVTKALGGANRTKVMAQGKGIAQAVLAEIINPPANDTASVPFPADTAGLPEWQFPTSTAYFQYLVTNGYAKVGWSSFAAEGIPAAPGTYHKNEPDSLTAFQAANNAWLATTGLSVEGPATAPFLITRNLSDETLYSGPDKVVDSLVGSPYGDAALIVIRAGGSGEVLVRRSLRWQVLNPDKLGNRLLRP